MTPKFIGLHHRSQYCLHCLEVPLSRRWLTRYADVIWMTEAHGPETCSLCTWASSIPSHSTCSLLSCHFIAPTPYICCLRGIKSHFIWVSGGRNPERYLYTPQSISAQKYTTFNQVLQGVVPHMQFHGGCSALSWNANTAACSFAPCFNYTKCTFAAKWQQNKQKGHIV